MILKEGRYCWSILKEIFESKLSNDTKGGHWYSTKYLTVHQYSTKLYILLSSQTDPSFVKPNQSFLQVQAVLSKHDPSILSSPFQARLSNQSNPSFVKRNWSFLPSTPSNPFQCSIHQNWNARGSQSLIVRRINTLIWRHKTSDVPLKGPCHVPHHNINRRRSFTTASMMVQTHWQVAK